MRKKKVQNFYSSNRNINKNVDKEGNEGIITVFYKMKVINS